MEKDLINIKGFRRAAFINGVQTYDWYIFFVTRKPYATGVTGVETARLEVKSEVFNACGVPRLNEVYEVVYGPKDTLRHYALFKK